MAKSNVAKIANGENVDPNSNVENQENGSTDSGGDSGGTETEASSKKRQAKASVTYVMPDGSEKNFPVAETSVIRIEVTDGTKRDFDVSNLSENVKHCAMLQGVVTRFQRGYQAIKEIDKVVESIDGTIEDLNNGIWLEVGTGEPRVTNLITAIVMALEAQGTHERLVEGKVTDEHRKDITTKLSADETFRKSIRERPAIAANLAQLASEAAQKRLEEKRKAAQASAADDTAGF